MLGSLWAADVNIIFSSTESIKIVKRRRGGCWWQKSGSRGGRDPLTAGTQPSCFSAVRGPGKMHLAEL